MLKDDDLNIKLTHQKEGGKMMYKKNHANQQNNSTQDNPVIWLFKKILLIGIVAIPILIIWAFLTGELMYVETFSIPGESHGYIGVRSKLMDSPEHFKEAFEELKNRKEFKGSEPAIMDISYNPMRVNATIRVPDTDNYVDRYTYNGRSILFRWANDIGQNVFYLDDQQNLIHPGLHLSDIDLDAMFHFLKQIQHYQETHQIEASSDYTPSARLDINFDEDEGLQLSLRGSLDSLRESYDFRAKANGEDFEVNTGQGFPSDLMEMEEENLSEQTKYDEISDDLNAMISELRKELGQELENIMNSDADAQTIDEMIEKVFQQYQIDIQGLIKESINSQ